MIRYPLKWRPIYPNRPRVPDDEAHSFLRHQFVLRLLARPTDVRFSRPRRVFLRTSHDWIPRHEPRVMVHYMAMYGRSKPWPLFQLVRIPAYKVITKQHLSDRLLSDCRYLRSLAHRWRREQPHWFVRWLAPQYMESEEHFLLNLLSPSHRLIYLQWKEKNRELLQQRREQYRAELGFSGSQYSLAPAPDGAASHSTCR